MERSLILIKPNAVEQGNSENIQNIIRDAGFLIRAIKTVIPTIELMEKHYEEHKGRSYYENLIEFMVSGDIQALVVEGENCISGVRKLIPEIRKLYGEASGPRNAIHASDAPETAAKELELWFPEHILSNVYLTSFISNQEPDNGTKNLSNASSS